MPAAPHEPPGDHSAHDRITLDESLNGLLGVVLQSLTPAERVAFVLHDVFGVPFRSIADIVGRRPDATRSLARSARQQVRQRRERGQPDRNSLVVQEFSRACTAGERQQLEPLLDPDITVVVDSGGAVRASVSPVRGLGKAAPLLIRLFANEPPLVVSEQSVNGDVGLVLRRVDRVVAVVSVNVRNGLVLHAWIVANPDKLLHWNTPSQPGRLPGHSG